MRRIGLLLLAVCALTSQVHAQGVDVDSRYQALVEDAVMEFGEGRYAEARALFAQAHQLRPNARTLRGLGMTAFELRNYTEAVRMLKASQLSRINPLTAQQQEHVAGLIERAEAFVGTYEIKAPEGTAFEVDGIRKQVGDDGTLMLDTGKRTVVAVLADGARDSRTIDVRGREHGVLEFHAPAAELAAVPGAPPAAPPAEGAAPAGHTPVAAEVSYEDPGPGVLPWIIVGGGAALIAAGIVTGLTAVHNGQVVADKCPDGVPCGEDLGSVKDSAEALAITTDVLFVLGLAAGGVGTYMLLDGDDGESASLGASLAASRDGGGVTLQGAF